MIELNNEQIAHICHEANRGYQAAHPTEGIPVAPSWDEFPPDQQKGVIEGVRLAREGATAEELHRSWCEGKYADGWTYGPVKNPVVGTHPCLVPYEDLPDEQRVKDRLFSAIVYSLAPDAPLSL